jgi:autotransporter translocation and assembly factor TamB
VQNGSTVSFNPADGVTPSVDATATTSVPDPPTDVLLRITGLSTHLQLAFSSQPSYSQQQILGLLIGVQALGAVPGLAQSGGTANGVSVAGLGEGVLDTQLTQRFLQPFTSKLGGALGLSDLNVNYNTAGGVSTTAIRRLGKNISFTYGEQIGGANPRTSLGIRIGNSITSAQMTYYQTEGADAFGALTPFSLSNSLSNSPTNFTLESIEPPTGTGVIFSYQRHFW